MFVTRKISLLRAILFITAQIGGAVLGAIALTSMTPMDVRGTLGLTTIQASLTPEQGFGVEVYVQ